MDTEANITETVDDADVGTPEDYAPEDHGDFGEGIGTLENRILEHMEGKEEKEDVAPEDEKAEAVGGEEDSPQGTRAEDASQEEKPIFSEDGQFSLKAGDKLTEAQANELNRACLREADYTKKTQELAEVREAANEILAVKEQIDQDPKSIREHFEDRAILSAFTRQEMMHHGLAAGGVPVKAWNDFCEWYKESGESGADKTPQADPYVNQFGMINKEIQGIKNNFNQIQTAAATHAASVKEQEQQAAYDAEMNKMGEQVDEALTKFPSVQREDLLVQMARSDGTRTVEQLAKEWNDKLETRFQDYVKTKQKQRSATVKSPKGGSSVMVSKKAPKTWDEAESILDSMYGV